MTLVGCRRTILRARAWPLLKGTPIFYNQRRTMYREPGPQRRNRVVIGTPSARHRREGRRRPRAGVVAIGIIGAATLATFLALFITSRPYDPTDSTIDPQRDIPAFAIPPQSSPKPSPSAAPTPSVPGAPVQPGGDAGSATPDDTSIQSEIERGLASDATLSGLDVSTIVESGKVTIFGSVRSTELKSRVERAVRAIKGVIALDNQLVVTEPAR